MRDKANDLIKKALQDAIQPGGFINQYVSKTIQTEFDKFVDDQNPLGKTLSQAINKLVASYGPTDKNHPLMQEAAKTYPWIWVLTSATPEELDHGWKLLQIDRNYEENAVDLMANPQLAQAFALSLANPSVTQLSIMRDQLIFKQAPKQKWKTLILPTHGGSPDKLRGFLTDKAEQSQNNHCKALARALAVLQHAMERRYTVMASSSFGVLRLESR